jgi:hypothetical protein
VPASRIYSVADMFADPQFLAREMLHTVKLPDGRDCRMPGVVPKLSATPGGSEWIGPALGEHTDAVLATLGYDARASPRCAGRRDLLPFCRAGIEACRMRQKARGDAAQALQLRVVAGSQGFLRRCFVHHFPILPCRGAFDLICRYQIA